MALLDGATFDLNDGVKEAAFIAAAGLTEETPDVVAFLQQMQNLNSAAPISTVALAGVTLTITFKDARWIAIKLVNASPLKTNMSMGPNGTAGFTGQEYDAIRPFGLAVLQLKGADTLTAMQVAYV